MAKKSDMPKRMRFGTAEEPSTGNATQSPPQRNTTKRYPKACGRSASILAAEGQRVREKLGEGVHHPAAQRVADSGSSGEPRQEADRRVVDLRRRLQDAGQEADQKEHD